MKFTDGLGYRAFGIFAATAIAVLMALLVPDAVVGMLLAIIVGGGVGAYFFYLADKHTGRKPPS